uniref:Armadillo-type fold protein n=1 Tax=Tanacetum cinerariifolium TaxID=118510 RepID=A0A6L2MX89_TANCI|nr:armadillo-type fold protein [Tanacetum cinerariifolium]
MNQRTSTESQGSVHLPIHNLSPLKRNTSLFEPQTSTANSSSQTPFSKQTQPLSKAPEKKLTLFALRLAILEKAATGLGTLGFIWATVVLLGGFAITIDKIDFWLVTIILLIESTRIFSRSHELEWQHQATWSLTDPGVSSFRAIRSSSLFYPQNPKRNKKIYDNTNTNNTPSRIWVSSDVPILPYGRWVFTSSNISKLLYWLQLGSAAVCVFISVTRLVNHNFDEEGDMDMVKINRKAALSIFYGLALAEAMLFLLEKAYWEWNVMYKKMLEQANEDLELGHTGMVSVRRFFYDAYSKCVNLSIFDGLKMDMVSFAMELLNSDSSDEQLIGVRIFERFTTNSRFSEDTLQKIGITISVVERLVEMLNWKDPQEEEIRMSAGKIIVKLVGKKQNALRVAGIPGAMESISSLLHDNQNLSKKEIIDDHGNYDHWSFNQLGLLILKKLACDHDNCGKIGNTRGLLTKIIEFTHADERLLKYDRVTEYQISTVQRSLQVVKMLVSSTGVTGTQLRMEISELVFTISYIRDILKYGENHPRLQKLGIDILTSLALEDDATERIGGTGGVLKELFTIFFREEIIDSQNHVRIAAGEALGMLAFESTRNCHRILKLNIVKKLSDALESPLLRVNAARILRNLCIYSGTVFVKQLRMIVIAAPTVLKEIMTDDIKLQEVMVGLAAHMFKFMTYEEANAMFTRSGIHDAELAITLIQILKKNPNPPLKTPRIRRYVIELVIWMMKDNAVNIQTFKSLGMMEELERVMETTCELESFNIFSGAIGLSRHKISIHSLVETAMSLMADEY